jgi:two-component system CheB/CheR fusion protein
VAKSHRVFRAGVLTRRHRQPILLKSHPRYAAAVVPLLDGEVQRGAPKVERLIEQRVLSQYAVAGAAVNRRQEILYLFGPTEDYLKQPAGEARLDLLSWMRSGLYPKLRPALAEAMEHERRVTVESRVERDGAMHDVESTVEPLASGPGVYLVLFRDLRRPDHEAGADAPAAPPSEPNAAGVVEVSEGMLLQLEAELAVAREEATNLIEQLASANEDYRASHEELLSLNEELQSSNEELETSKEELQSLNEELVTINRQLEDRNAEMRSINADLRNLFTATETPTVFLDRHLCVRQFTPAATAVMRLVPTDVGRSIEHIKDRTNDHLLTADARRVLDNLAPVAREVTTTDGRWYSRRVLAYRADDDRIDGVCVTWSDVTAQKEATSRSEEARLFSEAIVDAVRTPLLVLDESLVIRSANPSFHETFALREGEAVGRSILDLLDGQREVPGLRRLLREAAAGRPFGGHELEHVFERVGRRVVILGARAMPRAAGPVLILLSLEDVTARRDGERADRDREQLLVEEHVRRDVLSMLGHELRNPLSALAYGLDLLPRAARREETETIQGMMRRQVDRIGGMLDHILDVARVVTGKIELAWRRVDLANVVRTAVEAVTPAVEDKGQELQVALPALGQALVRGDAVRLHQIVENLLNNAVTYTDRGGRITVSLTPGGGMARIAVADNGMGMDGDLVPHVFDLFVQGQRPLDRPHRGGLGLGLALVRHLTELHGGKVSASSLGRGRGSEFVVTLPLLVIEEVEEGERPAAPGVPDAAPRRVLIVDDEQDGRETLARLLELHRHDVRIASSGAEALEMERSFAPDVVLLDLGLSGMDGYEVARRIRGGASDGRPYLIAVSGYQRDDERLREAGFDDHLLKPPDFDDIASRLARLKPRSSEPGDADAD